MFLAATNSYKGTLILAHNPCFYLTPQEAVQKGITRPVQFDELLPDADPMGVC